MTTKPQRYIVTGGAGFIGSHLVDHLIALNHDVVVIDTMTSGTMSNLAQHHDNPRLTVIEKSILDPTIEPLMDQCDGIFHLAALPSVQYSLQHPQETHDVNLTGTLTLLELAKQHAIPRFVFASSAAVYGSNEQLPLHESLPPQPLSPYAVHKLTGEYYCRLYHDAFHLNTVVFRFFNVYGPRQNPTGGYASLIPKTCARINSDQLPEIYGDGSHTRDFVFVTDVVQALLAAATTTNEHAFGQVMNIGSGVGISVSETIAALLVGSPLKPVHKPAVLEVAHSVADISVAKKLLNWSPQTTFPNGITVTKKSFLTKL